MIEDAAQASARRMQSGKPVGCGAALRHDRLLVPSGQDRSPPARAARSSPTMTSLHVGCACCAAMAWSARRSRFVGRPMRRGRPDQAVVPRTANARLQLSHDRHPGGTRALAARETSIGSWSGGARSRRAMTRHSSGSRICVCRNPPPAIARAPALHLYIALIDFAAIGTTRTAFMTRLRNCRRRQPGSLHSGLPASVLCATLRRRSGGLSGGRAVLSRLSYRCRFIRTSPTRTSSMS